MKNNTLAMVATISLIVGVASLIGYIDPAVCPTNVEQAFITCQQSASEHIWGFVGFTAFGLVTLVVGTISNRRRSRKSDSN